MARFMSGEENTKYDKVTDPEMIERMNRFEDNVGNVIKTNVEDISNEINALRTAAASGFLFIVWSFLFASC